MDKYLKTKGARDMKMKKFVAMLLGVMMVFSTVGVSADDTTPKRTINEVANDSRYERIEISPKDIWVDDENGIVKFTSKAHKSDPQDTNTYVINKDTVFSENEYEVEAYKEFKAGEMRYIGIVIDKDKYYLFNDVQNQEIIVHGVYGVWQYSVGIGGESGEKFDESKIKQAPKKDYPSDYTFERLKNYKILNGDENGDLQLDKLVTRAEMAQFIGNVRMLNEISADNITAEIFADVPKRHWAYNVIHVMRSMQLINGVGENEFMPDIPVTYAEAIKMIVSTLGYDPYAEKYGGYPDGYIKAGEVTGLTGSITFVADDFATRRDIAIMLDTALDVPLMRQTVYGSAPYYEVVDDMTLATELEAE